MMYNNLVIFILTILLLISFVNYYWLSNYSNNNFQYITNFNNNKYDNINMVTYTYLYPKKWTIDKCYDTECNTDKNVFDVNINKFHNELYNLSNNKNIVIVKNTMNLPLSLSIDDLNAISSINSNKQNPLNESQ